MKIVKKAGKQIVKMSKLEWLDIGKKAGWAKTASNIYQITKALSEPDRFGREAVLKSLQEANRILDLDGTDNDPSLLEAIAVLKDNAAEYINILKQSEVGKSLSKEITFFEALVA